MEVEEVEVVLMHLKYCERCGALFMRAQDDAEAYCPTCTVQMSELDTCCGTSSCLDCRRTAEPEPEFDADGIFVCSEGGHA